MNAERTDASQAYESSRREIDTMLDLLRSQLDKHASRARSQGLYWGHAGDLAHVRESLRDILVFVVGGYDEKVAGKMIEDAIAGAMAGTKETK